MTSLATPAPEPGQIVRVRSRQYLVEATTPPPAPGEQTLVRLSCLDDDAQGVPLEVLWESEIDALPVGRPTWQRAAERGFDAPQMFASYLHALRWNTVTSTNPKLFQAPYRAGIEVMAYQLEPLRKALLLPRVNLFIADDVGLGKTIEAGLILRELIMRQKVRRVVVACPPSVVTQWRDELESRFGLSFVVLDREYVSAKRRERGFSVNPWTTHSRFIISHALLRDESYTASLRDWLGDFSHGALLILDEAHNAAPASGSRYAIDSRFTRVIRDLAPRFEHRLFLSATPHNGHSNSFAALLELLDPQRFTRGVPVKNVSQLEPVMVRRLKEDLREIAGGFPKRVPVQHDIVGLPDDAPELLLPRLLNELKQIRQTRLAGERKSTQSAAALVIINLQKRLLSSIEAFALTLGVHRRSVVKWMETAHDESATAELDLSLLAEAPGNDDDRAELTEEDLDAEEAAQMDAATAATTRGERALLRRELELVDEMLRIAQAARGLPDARVRKVIDWVREHMISDGEWNDRRVLIFTEYVDTKRYLEQQLVGAFADTDGGDARIDSFTGGMGEDRRRAIREAFNRDPRQHPLRILIATDAAREGVNLQNWCADVFHLDVPWNPSRMEQRIGRIDRKLQREKEVRSHYFVLRQRTEDRVIEVLVKKLGVIRAQLGSLSTVVERRLEKMLSGGIAVDDADRLRQGIEEADVDPETRAVGEEELEAARVAKQDLARQLDMLRDLLETSRRHLDLTVPTFHNAINSSLRLLGAEQLTHDASDEAARWRFPTLDRTDASWADTLDALRAPRRPEQKPWEWRRQAPIRPIVFEDPGTLDGEVVHLHLEHRVVQRLLTRFLAQGFVRDDLSRACVGQTRDAIPRVVLLGRLSLYGAGASRLHDEIVAIAARWSDVDARSAPLKPYAEEAEGRTLELLHEILAEPTSHTPNDQALARLLLGIERDVAELEPHLHMRAAAVAERAVQKLAARGDKERREMREVIAAQRDRISARVASARQLVLDLDEERRQLEADRRHWHRRLASLEQELESEPARIRAIYDVQAQRVDPVGIVYLWPVSG
jgi:superfamily II DNA or RNA helicase